MAGIQTLLTILLIIVHLSSAAEMVSHGKITSFRR
ncbi:unnamed protein product [Linum tenue]|uniref:Uncharacterized protein n=1 Tax=Linum tenue TaxID=586396 RepID=A0AAV0MBV2_9ROSI|nr:unnamed protein product [Linum tenue]